MGSSLSNESANELIQKVCSLIRAELIDRRVAVHPAIGEVDELNELGRCVVSAATLLDVGNGEVLQNMVYADGDEPLTVDELVANADGELEVSVVLDDVVDARVVYTDFGRKWLVISVRNVADAKLLTFRWLFGMAA